MTKIAYMFAVLAVTGPALGQNLTCETRGNLGHCWDRSGTTVLTQEAAPGGYAHSWDDKGHSATTWEHNGVSETWRTR
jgi:hypothetical protein